MWKEANAPFDIREYLYEQVQMDEKIIPYRVIDYRLNLADDTSVTILVRIICDYPMLQDGYYDLVIDDFEESMLGEGYREHQWYYYHIEEEKVNEFLKKHGGIMEYYLDE